MSGAGCSFVVPIVLFYKSILLLGGDVSRYLVSRLVHMFPCHSPRSRNAIKIHQLPPHHWI